jgi:hypothetical protein
MFRSPSVSAALIVKIAVKVRAMFDHFPNPTSDEVGGVRGTRHPGTHQP